MSEAKHTPGPWEFVADAADGKHAIYATEDGYRVATVHNFNGRPMNRENASLIAAAPDLLEAAECARNVLFLLEAEVAPLGHHANNVREKLRLAIAKATGGSQ